VTRPPGASPHRAPTPHATYRGRFAPSPSGPLHLGSLLTALASYLEARSRGGAWLLRIDDLDPYRTQPGAVERILSSLESLGLYWDEAVVYQSRHTEIYRAGLEALQSRGLIYACACSRRELAMESTETAAGVYPGYCRDRNLPYRPGLHALRLRTGDAVIRFEDRVQGMVEQHLASAVGDFILFRRDGVFAYHLATVLDDAEQRVTDVLRGQDLLDSTPRQIYLQDLLNLPTPGYAHTPILIDSSGRKLSKRTLTPEAETRLPSRILGSLLALLGHPPPAELTAAPPREILAWAVENWRLLRLWQTGPITVEPEAFTP